MWVHMCLHMCFIGASTGGSCFCAAVYVCLGGYICTYSHVSLAWWSRVRVHICFHTCFIGAWDYWVCACVCVYVCYMFICHRVPLVWLYVCVCLRVWVCAAISADHCSYIWGVFLTDRLESKHKKLARQIDSILLDKALGFLLERALKQANTEICYV